MGFPERAKDLHAIQAETGMTKILKNNGLSLTLLGLFLACWGGQFATGYRTHNQDLLTHHRPPLTRFEYLQSGMFWEATFENWESEFLQMAIYTVFTAFLYQRGSSESNPLPDEGGGTKKCPKRYFRDRPLLRKLYENSLSLALFALFLMSFVGHLVSGHYAENLERAIAPRPLAPQSTAEFLRDSQFWFQSLQNWQSEFFSVAVMVVLTVFLRQKGSAQSKEVDAPHLKTGD